VDGAVRLLIRRPTKASRWSNDTMIAQVRNSSNEAKKETPTLRLGAKGGPPVGREDTTRMGTCYGSSASWQALVWGHKRGRSHNLGDPNTRGFAGDHGRPDAMSWSQGY
jgi:hypothetical protein